MNIERSVINHLGRFLSLPSLATKLSRIFSVLNPFRPQSRLSTSIEGLHIESNRRVSDMMRRFHQVTLRPKRYFHQRYPYKPTTWRPQGVQALHNETNFALIGPILITVGLKSYLRTIQKISFSFKKQAIHDGSGSFQPT
jgi:hypothetical protein